MIQASLILNIVVLVPVILGLILNVEKMAPVFGARTTARDILLCLYVTILLASGLLLFAQSSPIDFVTALLMGQVFYKLLSIILVRDKKTPVIWFNLAIAIFHLCTLRMIFA